MVRRRHRPQGDKYDARAWSASGRPSACFATSAPGSPPLHRFRIGLEFALRRSPRGRRHDRPARPPGAQRWASELGLPDAVLTRLGQLLRALGRAGLARRARRRRHPARLTHRPARRVRRGRPPHRRRRGGAVGAGQRRSGDPVRSRASSRGLCADAGEVFGDLDDDRSVAGGHRRRARARRRADRRASSTRRLPAVADFVDLKSPYTLGHSRAVAELAAAAGTTAGHAADDVRTLRRAGLVARLRPPRRLQRHLGQARAARRRRVGAGAHAPLHHRAHAGAVGGVGAPRRASPSSTGSAWTGPATPGGCTGHAIPPLARILGRRRRLPGHARAPPAPRRPLGRRSRRGAAGRGAPGRLDGDAADAVLAAAGHHAAPPS